MRQCTGKECLGWFPATLEYFYKTKGNKIGLTPECIECSKKRSLIVRHKNIELTRERDRLQYYKRRDSELIRMRQGYWDNKEDRLEYHRNWRQSEVGREIVNSHSRFKWMHGLHKITDQEWEYIKDYFNWECAYCGLAEIECKIIYEQQLHKDHVFHDGSNEIDNCVPDCKHCNTSKHNRELIEWYSEDKLYYNLERLNKVTKWVTEDFKMIDGVVDETA